MKLILISAIIALTACENVSRRPLIFSKWPPKSSNLLSMNRNLAQQGKRTFVVQIRSDNPVPIVLKRGQNRNGQHLSHQQALISRPMMRPVKITPNFVLKTGPRSRKPASLLKIKLPSTVKPTRLEKPYKYEKPSIIFPLLPESQNLPFENSISFITDHFAPIHTIPAPDLGIHDNHIHQEDLAYLPPKPQPYHSNQYQVTEEHTNDQTILDPFSGQQKLFAPDPDPSLPTSKIRPATEPFNIPSNGHPLPADVQSNYLSTAAQPLIQIVGGQQQDQLLPEIYPIQFTSQQQIRPFLVKPPIDAQSVPLYNPTYLVTQSNNLYTQHKQQLFKPNDVFATGYVNADLTQEVASNGQILQAAKDPINNIHPVLDTAPQFAALVATPPYHQAQALEVETAPFRLTNTAAQGGFVVSNFFSPENIQHSEDQENAVQREREQTELHEHQFELQQHHQQQQHQQLQQQQLQQQQLQQQQLQQQQLQQQQLQQQQQHQQLQLQQHQQQQLHHQLDPVTAAYEEHQRLLEQHLGESPLRIFVPDEENHSDGYPKLQKRSDNSKKETKQEKDSKENSLPVSTVKTSTNNQMEE